MLELLAVDSRHAMVNFEKLKVSMNFGSYVLYFLSTSLNVLNNPVEISFL